MVFFRHSRLNSTCNHAGILSHAWLLKCLINICIIFAILLTFKCMPVFLVHSYYTPPLLVEVTTKFTDLITAFIWEVFCCLKLSYKNGAIIAQKRQIFRTNVECNSLHLSVGRKIFRFGTRDCYEALTFLVEIKHIWRFRFLLFKYTLYKPFWCLIKN